MKRIKQRRAAAALRCSSPRHPGHAASRKNSVLTFGNIRSGRSDAQKEDIKKQVWEAVSDYIGLPPETVGVMIFDTPAHWAMEGGEIMPKPGQEGAWLAAHSNKLEVPVA